MNTIKLFMKEKQVNLLEMERALGIPYKSVRLDREIPKKYLDVIVGYLKTSYGYTENILAKEQADVPEGIPIMQKVWNKNFIPRYKDGILRYQDQDSGLWKRLMSWQSFIEKETGEVKINSKFLPATKEVFEDKLGRFYVAVNGIKIYKFDKEIK